MPARAATEPQMLLTSPTAPVETPASKQAARACVAAIVRGDADVLRLVWAGMADPMPPGPAQSLVLQAWRADKAGYRKGLTLGFGGLVSAIYIGVSEQFLSWAEEHELSEKEKQQDPASMLLCFSALAIDDPELLAQVLTWDDNFRLVTPGSALRAPTDRVAADFEHNMNAPKCAALWRHWFTGRALGHVPNARRPHEIVLLKPKPKLGGLTETRVCVLYKHPTFVRAQTLTPDLTKTVLIVQLDAPSGTTPKETKQRRDAAVDALRAMGHFTLEVCNMRVAFYDNGAMRDDFEADASQAAGKAGLEVAHACRLADPGRGLVVPEWDEPITVLEWDRPRGGRGE